MRILALCPVDPESVAGNAVTLRRVRHGLRARGHDFRILAVTPRTSAGPVRAEAAAAAPDVVHLYHAFKTGRLSGFLRDWPLVVTASGTDLSDDFLDPSRRAAIEGAFEDAARIVTYNESLASRIREALPRVAPKVRRIPKGVVLGTAPFDLRAAAALPAGRFLILQPGGIRPVKNPLFAIDALSPFRDRIALVFAGPLLEEPTGTDFLRRVAREPWVRHLPLIPPDAMAAAYRASDLVLNTSLAEGLSNALMEAMATGRAVLASDVDGNRDLLREEETGLLYRDAADVEAKARRLLEDPGLRRRLGDAARRHAEATFSTERELDALLEAYAAAAGD